MCFEKNCFHSHERGFQSGIHGIQGPNGSARSVLGLSKLPIRDFLGMSVLGPMKGPYQLVRTNRSGPCLP